jgi:hypothetical protein
VDVALLGKIDRESIQCVTTGWDASRVAASVMWKIIAS